MSEAHHYFRFWWFRPPAPAIQDVSFDDGSIAFANLRKISITRGVGITQNVRATLTPDSDPDFVAAVADGVLTMGGTDAATPDAILLSSTSTSAGTSTIITTTTNVEILVDPTELRGSFFSSIFRTGGVAVITCNVVEEDVATGDILSDETTTVVSNVSVYGSIHRHASTGVYHLRGSVRGFNRELDVDDFNYTFLSMYFNAEAPIPVAP